MLHGAQDRNTITLATGISILMAVGRIRLAKFLGLMMCSVLGTLVILFHYCSVAKNDPPVTKIPQHILGLP